MLRLELPARIPRVLRTLPAPILFTRLSPNLVSFDRPFTAQRIADSRKDQVCDLDYLFRILRVLGMLLASELLASLGSCVMSSFVFYTL